MTIEEPIHEWKFPSHIKKMAYETYSHIYGGNGRRGFSNSEIIAFLYAHSFPKDQWKDKSNEAFDEMGITYDPYWRSA